MRAFWSIRHLSKNTQNIYAKNLKRLGKHTDLNDPMNVEGYVFGIEVTNKYRNTLFDAYAHFCKANEIEWDRSWIKPDKTQIKLPTEENIDKIVSSASLRCATVFQLSKHGLA